MSLLGSYSTPSSSFDVVIVSVRAIVAGCRASAIQ
jgi:hypothetical protein